MKSLAVLLCIAAICSIALADRIKFRKFKAAHGKKYHNETHESHKMKHFQKFHEKVEACNAADHDHECGHNEFSDNSPEEWAQMHGAKPEKPNPATSSFHVFDNKRQAPSSYDWRTVSGVVAPIKNQGSCGSCYIFGATAALEGQWRIKKGTSAGSLSEQQALDCLSTGCNGGWPANVFTYQKAGVQSMSSRPYTGRRGSCVTAFTSVARTTGNTVYVNNGRANDAAMQNAIATVGPLAVAVEATDSFMAYRSGIWSDNTCSDSINHAVVAVGYSPEFWIIRNSWGTSWGESGYIRISRKGNNCAITNFAMYPTV